MTCQKTVLMLVMLMTPISVWAAPLLKSELIFPEQGKHCHGSSIAELPNGDLFAVWFQGSGERSANDVVVNGARLKQGSTEWSPVFLVADTPELPDCNPVVYLDTHDTLWLFWIRVVANRWEHSMLMYRSSTDYAGDGAPKWQWQDAITLVPGEDFPNILQTKFKEAKVDAGMWGEYAPPYSRVMVEAAQDKRKRQTGWMTRIHPIELAGGRILLPLYHDGFNISLAAISDDRGKTWRPSEPMVGSGPIQPTLVQKANGDLIAYFRDSGNRPGRVMSAASKDKGETWTIATDTDIPNPGSSLEVIALDNDHWAMIYNDQENGRHSLAVSLSDNEGETWNWTRHLDQTPPREGSFSYPSLIQTHDGMLHATYSYASGPSGKSIKHAKFNVDWIKAGD